MINIIKLIRIHQWVKNIFILAPLFFGGIIDLNTHLIKGILSFLSFSFVASAVYILNDYKDITEDRLHPVKKNRPLANGSVSKSIAITLFFIFLILGLSCMFLIDWKGFLILSFYFIMNIAYTFGLKKISIVDITIIAIGFVLRILIGGFVFNVALSNWIIIMTFLLAIFLAAAKRRDDVLVLTEKKIKTRKAIDGYNLMLIDGILLIVAAVILVSYIMYAISPATLKQYETNYLYITVIFVFLGLFRYLQITFVEKRSGSPTKVLYRDRFTQINLILWLFTYFVIIYW